METVQNFVDNFKLYYSGALEHEEISSLTIRRIMFNLNLWRVPLRGERWWRIGMSFICFAIGLAITLSGYPREFDIPEWGKFIDILAGVLLSLAKCIFLYYRRHELIDLIQLMDRKSQDLKRRGQGDPEIKKMRDTFYVQEMVVFLFTTVFGFIFLVLIFMQVLFTKPLQLVVPVGWKNEIVTGPSAVYWTVYLAECFLCPFVAVVITTCDVMIGNLYNQFILHLEVLHYDMLVLDGMSYVTPNLMAKKYAEFSRTYQSLLDLNKYCEKCMRPFFINNVLATVLATTFSCVEVGIMINVDPKECLKPFMYFLFITFPFFYWCWLGNRIIEKSTGLAKTAFIYNTQASNIFNQKVQLLFTHMVSEPMTISAKPFVVLNFDIFVRVMKVAYQFTAVFKNFYK